MKARVVKIILIFAFISIIRYIGIYVAIDSDNMVLLQVTSFCNPLINAEPVTTYIPLQFISDAAPFGRTPLSYACSDFWRKSTEYELETVKILLKNGADPNANNDSALEWCLRYNKGKNRYKIAKSLIDYGADYKYVIKYSDYSYLSNYYYLMDLLRTEKTDTEETNEERYDLFVDWLNNNNFYDLQYSFTTNTGKEYTYSYYDIVKRAIQTDCYNETKYILDIYDVDVNEEYFDDNITLLIVSIKSRNPRMFKLLIDNGGDINYVNSEGKTLDDFIYSIDFDYGYDENNKRTVLNYDKEKAEMIEILRGVREKVNGIVEN